MLVRVSKRSCFALKYLFVATSTAGIFPDCSFKISTFGATKDDNKMSKRSLK